MKLINKTKHCTSGLRIMLYDLAQKANISTRGVTVEIRRGTRNLHGLCSPYERIITLWLLDSSKTNDIGFVWLHELAHLTPRNRKLYALGHPLKGQHHADKLAEKVLGITKNDLTWRTQDWKLEPVYANYPTKAKVLQALKQRKYPCNESRTDGWKYRLSSKSKRGCYRLEMKYNKNKDDRLLGITSIIDNT